jgi:hypothetical protein
MTWIVELAVTVILSVLRAVIKNPGSQKIEGTVIAEIAQAATAADAVVNGTVWTSTPGVPTSVTQPPPAA